MGGSFQLEVERRIQELAGSSDWTVSPEQPSRAYVDVSVVYRIAFGSAIAEARAGELPANAVKLESAADLRTMIDALRTTKEKDLRERVERWIAEHAAVCDTELTGSTCLGNAATLGYHFACERCAGTSALGCVGCAGTGLRHVSGTLACHVSRAFSMTLRDAPPNAPAWLRQATSLERLRPIGDFVLGRSSYRSGLLELAYDGVIDLQHCDVDGTTVWALGPQERDFANVVQSLLEPTSSALRDALTRESDVQSVAAATRAFFAAPLHAGLRDEVRPQALEASVRDKLVSPEYLDQAHALGQRALRVMARAAGRGVSAWMVIVPGLLAFAVNAAPLRRMFTAPLAAAIALITYLALEWRARRAEKTKWGTTLPSTWRHNRAPARTLAWVGGVVAFAIAGLPSALPLRALHALGGPDRVTGIYANGEQRVLVLPTGRNTYVLRHLTPECDEFVLAELGITFDFERVGAGTPFVRSEGSSFVLLPDAGQGCGERSEPVRFTRYRGALGCSVNADRARVMSLAKQPFELTRGARVEVLPWQPDLRQVLVRSGSQIGTMRTRELDCASRLPALRDALFGAYVPDEPRAARPSYP
jgi:hypothetical protein